MARKPRLVYEGAIYHVAFRGNERRLLFHDDADRARLLAALADRIPGHDIRLYLYALMPNHVHLMVETPRANISAFMGSLLTSYATYFNRRHRRAGHLTQNRYMSVAVQGDTHLLRLSRYIHLNPVRVNPLLSEPLDVRLEQLRAYRWSSYRAYAGLADPESYVDYPPLWALTPGRGRNPRTRYRHYVESGVAETDEAFQALVNRARLGIGSDAFVEELEQRYRRGAQRVNAEDVAFRRPARRVEPEAIIREVCRSFQIAPPELAKRRLEDGIKPVAAALLTQAAGLTQREAAGYLGLTTGAAVCQLLKRLRQDPKSESLAILQRLMHEFNI